MFTLFFLLPLALTMLGMLAIPFLVSREQARAEAPYTPDMGSVEAWLAELDVALGVAWFDTTPMVGVEDWAHTYLVAREATKGIIHTRRNSRPTLRDMCMV